MTAVLHAVPVADFASWRKAVRLLLAQQVPPHDVQWHTAAHAGMEDLFGDTSGTTVGLIEHAAQPAMSMPRSLLRMLEAAACYRATDRWALLYRIVWRWHHGDRSVWSAADEDGRRLHSMIKTVGREAHKMHAFLRFRERPEAAGDPRFVAWFEPLHDVLPQAAAHFARRMGYTSWLIATPEATAAWNGTRLEFGPPSAQGPLDIDDAGERLWLAYYRSTFNPARLNTQAMELHMPVRYWKNMPEARLIPDLISHAAAGAQRIAQTEAVGVRRGVSVQVSAEDAQPHRKTAHALDACRRCNLWCHATQVVPGIGPDKARIMLVGEQPGDQEDLAGIPFTGPAGQLLDRALTQADIARDTVYVTNAVKHFKWEPRGKRRLHKTPAQQEIDACMMWLEQEIAECDPAVIVTLGSTALKSVMHAPKITMQAVAGATIEYAGRLVMPTWHPAFILRVPDAARQQAAFDDMVHALRKAGEQVKGRNVA